MAAAMVVASIPKAQGAEMGEQSCIAQAVQVGYNVSLFWPLLIRVIINMLFVSTLLKLVWRPNTETQSVYPRDNVLDAGVSGELPLPSLSNRRTKSSIVL